MADCSGVRTTGHWKGHRCGSPGLHIFDGKWWCANHFPINDSIEQIAYLKRQLSEANKKLDERDRAVAKRCVELVISETLEDIKPDDDGDRAYNEAIRRVTAVIRGEFGLEG